MTDVSRPRAVNGPDSFVVRRLTQDDAEAYAALLIEIWQETYGGLMPDDRLAALDHEPTTARAAQFLGDPATAPTWGAFDGEQLMGWARAGAPRDDDAPVPLELASLNVARAARGSGLAARLMEHALDGRSAYLWVVEGNERARRFYERHGFVADGVRRWEETDGTHEVRMQRLSPPGGAADDESADFGHG